tara:strand:+ start:911 stop:1039 length:129 start_codon:yes stop_codon:yes gene_type:complete
MQMQACTEQLRPVTVTGSVEKAVNVVKTGENSAKTIGPNGLT